MRLILAVFACMLAAVLGGQHAHAGLKAMRQRAMEIARAAGQPGPAPLNLRSSSEATSLSVPAVPTLNVTQYLGTWLQAYASATVLDTFESNSTCVNANYGLNPNGTISVLNKAYKNGAKNYISGWATAYNTAEPAELTVYLQGTPFGAPYWIIQVGNTNANGLYDWAVVSDQFQLTLWVLVRDYAEYMQNYDAGVQKWLVANNFTSLWNSPINTPQTGCTYF